MAKSREVEAWMAAYENPMKPVVQRVREILLGSDPKISECIKWKTPTFVYEGNLASFNPRAKKFASLMFHTGAEIPGKHPKLAGGGEVGRYMNIASVEEAEELRGDLERIVAAWIELKDGGAKKAPAAAKTSAKKKPAAAKTAANKKPAAAKTSAKKKPGAAKTAKTAANKRPAAAKKTRASR